MHETIWLVWSSMADEISKPVRDAPPAMPLQREAEPLSLLRCES
jgi:hypothetical protein